MKIFVRSVLVLFVAGLATAFTTPTVKKINVSESSIQWTGKKVVGGSHTGTIALKSGELQMSGGSLTGGMFVVDMTSINNTDLEGKGKQKLEGHLKSDDFFGVENYPEASFKITSASKSDNGYKVTGDLTVKGKTQSVSFDMAVSDGEATAKFTFDRSKHDVQYGSGSFFDNLGDRAISDDIMLDIVLKF